MLTLRGTCNAMIIFVGKKGGDRRSWNVTEIARENTRMAGRSVAVQKDGDVSTYRTDVTLRQQVRA